MTSVGQNPNEASFRDVIRVDESQVRQHVDELVRASVEQTLNGLLDAEADELCGEAVTSVRWSGWTRGRGVIAASC